VMQFKGTDADLIKMYWKAHRDIEAYQAGLPFEYEEEPIDVSGDSDTLDDSDDMDVSDTPEV